ncbi:hypothetical protein V1478_009894 [Vespula squamosa]|uniref:Uncharacterized protein n=1 Tax=Vespula squamosa TaxID=30214 RepID=A0ABD2AJR5_VESSQ
MVHASLAPDSRGCAIFKFLGRRIAKGKTKKEGKIRKTKSSSHIKISLTIWPRRRDRQDIYTFKRFPSIIEKNRNTRIVVVIVIIVLLNQ